MMTWTHLVTNSAALNKWSRPSPNADMTDNITLCTIAFIRHMTFVTSAIKLSHACYATRCFSHCSALVDTRPLSRHASPILLTDLYVGHCFLLYFCPWEWGFGLYTEWLIRKYTQYLLYEPRAKNCRQSLGILHKLCKLGLGYFSNTT